MLCLKRKNKEKKIKKKNILFNRVENERKENNFFDLEIKMRKKLI